MTMQPTKDATQTSEPDVADIIAGELQTSRGHAYELMERALAARDCEGTGAAPVDALAEECKREARHLFNLTDDAEDMVHLSMAIDRLRDAAKTAYNTGRLDAWNEIRAARDTSPAACITGDAFNGDTPHLVRCINALLSIDAAGRLVPDRLGGHARVLLSAAANRLAAPAGVPQDSAPPLLDKAADPPQDPA